MSTWQIREKAETISMISIEKAADKNGNRHRKRCAALRPAKQDAMSETEQKHGKILSRGSGSAPTPVMNLDETKRKFALPNRRKLIIVFSIIVALYVRLSCG